MANMMVMMYDGWCLHFCVHECLSEHGERAGDRASERERERESARETAMMTVIIHNDAFRSCLLAHTMNMTMVLVKQTVASIKPQGGGSGGLSG